METPSFSAGSDSQLSGARTMGRDPDQEGIRLTPEPVPNTHTFRGIPGVIVERIQKFEAQRSGNAPSPPDPRQAVGPAPAIARRLLYVWLVVGLARGLFWVVLTEVPGLTDEAHHLAYIESIAAGRGIPIVGQDLVSTDIRRLMRYTRTGLGRSFPLDVASPEGWGASGEQYEAIQPPAYYLLMALPFKLFRPVGLVAALYAVRVATLLLALAAVPLTWLLARELFPRLPSVWILAPALLVMVNGFNSTLASATNDALVVPVTVAALWLIARGWRSFAPRSAIACGVALGLCVLAKSNSVAVWLLLPLGAILLPTGEKRPLRQRLRWVLTGMGTGLLIALPWLARNVLVYGSVTGGSQIASKLLAPMVEELPLDYQGTRAHFFNSIEVFWQFRNFGPGPSLYGRLFFLAVLASLGCGVAVGRYRRRLQDTRSLLWLGSSWPVVFGLMLFVVYSAYTGSIVGRHLFPALVPLVIVLVAGLQVGLGPKVGTIALCGLLIAVVQLERWESKKFLDHIYGRHLVAEGVGSVVDQDFNAGWVDTGGVRISSACPVRFVGLAFQLPAPREVMVQINGESRPARLVRRFDTMAIYGVKPPYPKDFEVRLPAPAAVGSSPTASATGVTFSDRPGFPQAQVHCRVLDARQMRFEQLYEPSHPRWVTYGKAVAWGDVWGWGVNGLVVTALAAQGLRWWSRRDKGPPE